MQPQCHILAVKYQYRNKGNNLANIVIYVVKWVGKLDLSSLIADRCHSLFGHICRLSRDTPVS